mmetsp:Transcript_9118/g.30396  ORF Transcript_9118/g.30396 Transcript_9118/m.30396 type:complete len:493 (+) Transcript_9118:118-1596(+)
MTSAATASFVPTALIGSRGRDVSRRGTTHVAARREPFRRAASRAVAVLAEAKAVAPPLTKKDLVDYLASGCKPKENWRIGTEHEKFGFQLGSLKPIEYEAHVQKLLQALVDRFDWAPMMEGEFIIGALKDGQSVTLEPGGQFELSGAPLVNLHQTCAEVHSHLYQVKTVCKELGVAFLGVGFQPKWSVEDTPVMPKGRYKVMKKYMPTVGTRGLDMMFRTCTIQVNLDFKDEEDMIRKFRTSLALQPIATALFANSPFCDGKPSGSKSLRSKVWEDTDAARTGTLAWVFEPDFGFEKYAEYIMDVPMYFVYREGKYVDVTGQSWRDFMEGKLPQFPGVTPTLDDWEQHLTTAFPEVRLKRYMEMRGGDGGSWNNICALPALWVGLLYDAQALADAEALVSDWTAEEREYLRTAVTKDALQTPFRNGTVQDVAIEMCRIAKEGLTRRGANEENFVDSLIEMANTGVTGSDEMLEKYVNKWGMNIDKIYDEYVF